MEQEQEQRGERRDKKEEHKGDEDNSYMRGNANT